MSISQLRQRSIAPPCIAVLIASTFYTPGIAQNPSYTITDIGPVFSVAGVNKTGQVAGTAPDPSHLAFIWENGTTTSIPALPGYIQSNATAINDSGHIAGYSAGASGTPTHAFIWTKSGGVKDLITQAMNTTPATIAFGYGINNSDSIVGDYVFPQAFATNHAFSLIGNLFLDIGVPGAVFSTARAINSGGQAVGFIGPTATNVNLPYHAVLFANGVMTDLNNTAGIPFNAVATAINDSGQVAGYGCCGSSATSPRPFLYSSGQLTFLDVNVPSNYVPALGALTNGINKNAQIVGAFRLDASHSHAFIYTSGALTDLNTTIPSGTGWELVSAKTINDSGQIVGTGTINGSTHGFLLTPTAPVAGSVLNDDFSGTTINPALWSVNISPTGGGTVAQTNQRLEMIHILPGVVSYQGVQSRCKVSGDFDVQVDFSLLNWPALNFHTVRLSAADLPEGPLGQVGIYRNSYNAEGYQYRTASGVVTDISVTDTSGKLRLARAGNVISGYYWNGNNFVLLGSASSSTGDTGFNLDLSNPLSTSPAGVAIAFDNFTLNAGTAICPANQLGSITVLTNLDAATFTISGPSQTFTGSGKSASFANAIPGDYTIVYGSAAGQATPPTETKTLMAGGTIGFAGNYVPASSGLAFVLNPSTYSTSANSSITTTGTITNTSSVPLVLKSYSCCTGNIPFSAVTGKLLNNTLAPGQSLTTTTWQLAITQNAIPGTYTGNQSVIYSVSGSQTQTITANADFKVIVATSTGVINVTTNVSQATFDIEPGHYVGSGKTFTQPSLPPGSYTVSYSSVAGCTTTPPKETKQLLAGGSVTFSAVYGGCTGTIEIENNIANSTYTLSRTQGPPVRGGGPYPVLLRMSPFDIYTLTFDRIDGYNTPPAQTKELDVGGLTDFSTNYSVNGTAGLGKIQVSTNLQTASFGVVSVSSTSFTPFTRSGQFYDTGLTIPAGTYRISYTPIPGYYTPPDQTLTLNPSGTIQFAGTYRRFIVVLFTGFSNAPTPGTSPDGITYPDDCPTTVDNCPGINRVANLLRTNIRLKAGILAKTFTFYTGANLNPSLPIEPQYNAPPDESIHVEALNWLKLTAQPKAEDRVIVIGHSYGGNRARLFAQALPQYGLSADLLITEDPIDWMRCSIQTLVNGGFGHCDQSSDTDAFSKQPSITDVMAFTQADSTLPGGLIPGLRGYHFQGFPFSVMAYPACGTALTCSHSMIDDDLNVQTAIIDRMVGLLSDPKQPIYNVNVAGIGTTAAVITWRTSGTTDRGGVMYSTNADATTGGVDILETTGAGTSHSASLSGLTANTRYYFRVRARIPGSTTFEYSSIGFFQTSAANVPFIRPSNATLTAGPNGTNLTVTLTNFGAAATNGTMTAAAIGATKATVPFPLPIPDLSPGNSFMPVLPFPSNLGFSGTIVYPSVTLKYSSLTLSVSLGPVKLP